jgi:Family of unknown function (DUF5723)
MYFSKAVIVTLSLLFIKIAASQAQEQLGLRLDNYSGVNAIALNPAGSTTYPMSWDINLVGVGATFHNNLGYIEKASIGKAARNANDIGPDPALNIFYDKKAVLEYNFKNKNQYYGSISARIMGPSFIIKLNSGHSFGLFSSVRASISSHNLPKILNPYEMNKIKRGQTFDVDPFKGGGLVWSEFGVNYAYKIGGDTEGGLTIGANVKYLQGLQAFFIENREGTKMARISEDTFRVDGAVGTLGFTNSYNNDISKPNGKGFGFDIGVMMTTVADDSRPYEWRMGASILDIGKIRITKNTEVHEIALKEALLIEEKDFENLNTNDPLTDALRRLNQKAYNDSTQTLKGNAMSFGLLSALQLQADYAFTNKIFLNTLLIQRIPLGNVIQRDNLLAFTPRYETRWLGASMPISIINYQQLRIGLAARLAFLTLGTEHLLSFMSNSNLYGTDFYFALKLNPFNASGFSKGKKGNKSNWGKGKKVNCYKF